MLRQGFIKVVLPRGTTDHGRECMQKIRAMLAAPKAPGTWWAREVLDNAKSGTKTSTAAIELAEKALAGEGQRVPGEDDE